MWIFGYGSLVWKPGFPFLESGVARLDGFARRFWQGSPDHRGTEEEPGRVVTLIEDASASCVGRAFRLAPEVYASILPALDHREQGGYVRHAVELALLADDRRVPATIYVAGPDNAHFLGPAPLEEMARHIATSVGPSGRNDEYLVELARWLRRERIEDSHVFALEAALAEL